jgi:hypothetical protein
LQDLELHQSFLKRVKVLVNTFSELADQLLEGEEERERMDQSAEARNSAKTGQSTETGQPAKTGGTGREEGKGQSAETGGTGQSAEAAWTGDLPADTSTKTVMGVSKTPESAGWISFRSKRHLDRTAALADSLRKFFSSCNNLTKI